MKLQEFREYMAEYEQKVETHTNTWVIMCKFIVINDLITLNNVCEIRIVGSYDKEIWFNDNHLELKKLNKIHIGEVKSYIKNN